ncbi:unnamed protein product, partial [Symbiodinium sp. KB8]
VILYKQHPAPLMGQARVQCLQKFANHELQAIEMFAWALLRFPDAPTGLQRGLLKTIREEQSHCRLYLDRVAALAPGPAPLGPAPLSGYLWRSLESVNSANEPLLAFLCGIGLTFEAANLDHSLRYRDIFRQAGDEDSAAVLQRVHDEAQDRPSKRAAEFEMFEPGRSGKEEMDGSKVGMRRRGLRSESIEELALAGLVWKSPKRSKVARLLYGGVLAFYCRDEAFMERLRTLAREALTWHFLEDHQRVLWAAVLEFDAVPTQDLPPWFFERQNFTRRHLGVDLFSLDGKRAVLCRAGNATHEDVKRFLRTANCVCEAPQCTLWTFRGCKIARASRKWLRNYGCQHQILAKRKLRMLQQGASASSDAPSSDQALPFAPPLRPCQEACLEACAKGARVIEMACGTGKTRVIRELVAKQTEKVLVTVPSRVLVEQFAVEIPGFCKVGTHYNNNINMQSHGFIAVTDSVHLLQKLQFAAIFVDEAHHRLPSGLPSCKELFQFSATQKGEVDFRYSLGEAIEEGVLCDYDLTVPIATNSHPYICLANLLLSQAGRFRRVLAYCNSIAEAKRFRQVLETVGLAAWHINGRSSRQERDRVMREFAQDLQKPVHVLVTVQVLGEGINIPNADTCMFVEPRSSYVSIIQAIGRVLRPHPSKPFAHIVLPAIAMAAVPASDVTPRGPRHDLGDSCDAAKGIETETVATSFASSRQVSGDSAGSASKPESVTANLVSRQASSRNRADVHDTSLVQYHDPEKEAGLRSRLTRPGSSPERSSSMQPSKTVTAAADTWLSAASTRPAHETNSELVKVEEHREATQYRGPGANNAKPASTCQKLKVKMPDRGVGLFGRESTGQLERFLQVIGNADSRFVDVDPKFLQSRIYVSDCQLQRGVSLLWGRSVQNQLALILQRRDPWELRLQAVEEFVQQHGILPREITNMPHEKTLAYWLRGVGVCLKKRLLTAARMEKLLDSSCGKLRALVQKWLDPQTPFERYVQKLREFVRLHHRMPMDNSALLKEEYNLAQSLKQFVFPGRKDRERRLQILEKEGPIVAKWVASKRTRHPRPNMKKWRRALQKLVEFLDTHGRMPQAGSIERPMYVWLLKQRKQLDRLPADLRAELLKSHPVVASFLQS